MTTVLSGQDQERGQFLMIILSKTLRAMAVCCGLASAILLRPSAALAQDRQQQEVAALGEGFKSATVELSGATLHYVRGGSGPVIVLLHGFPQDWYEWHDVMPRLSKNFTVIAVDLRGVGGSTATQGGYDAASVAEDILQLTQELDIDHIYLAGHDIGGLVAYAFAHLHPEKLRGLMILDVLVIGISPEPEVRKALWHIDFHQLPDVPERIIAGRQASYFRWFFDSGTLDPGSVDEAELEHYAKAYASPEQLRAGLGFYRALPISEAFNVAHRSKIDVPLVLTSGNSRKGFGRFFERHAQALKEYGWSNVAVELIEKSGHYLTEDQPAAVAELIARYASR
jgi:pimeloyl-ACP methyl ester carboxylesterase